MSSFGKNIGYARSNMIDLGTQVLRLVNNVRDAQIRGVDSMFGRLGYQRRSIAKPLLWFAAGAVVAGGVALFLAPMTGDELMQKATNLLGRAADDVQHKAMDAVDKVRGTTHELAKEATKNDSSKQRVANGIPSSGAV
ncbi:MAG TPA: YtxH domain-containing protein [Polyangiaceae bacterium]